MKVVAYERYGSPDVLQVKDVAKPQPGALEVLIRTHAATVTSADGKVRSLKVPFGFGLLSRLFFGISKPRQPVLGTELAGEIVAVGQDVSKFKVGDQVFAFSGTKMGCHAEYKCMPEDGAISLKPAKLTFDEAAALSFAGTTALDFFRRANLRSGERVLVIGASGAVGTAAVQLAKHFGADVTGVCSSANVDLVRSLGATRVIDYTSEAFTHTGESYDVVMDTVGATHLPHLIGTVKEGGRLLLLVAGLPDMLRIPWICLMSKKKIIAGPAAERAEDLRFLAKLAEAGKYMPVIDRRYPFEQIAEAHRHVDSGRKTGNVIIKFEQDCT